MNPTTTRLQQLNAMSPFEARAVLLACCHSGRWADAMLTRRPFADAASLLAAADEAWSAMGREDRLEAFAHHPRIGERNLLQPKFAGTASVAEKEQAGMDVASEQQRGEFNAGNAEYERRFGHVFLLCATGKSAEQMLGQLRTRLSNDAATEFINAAYEQGLITRLRLERWLSA